MSLGINHNITALNAWRQLKMTDRKLSGTMEKLSSGLRINRAADDPAGLVISEKMRAQIVGLEAAVKNSEKAINMVATAEASLDKVMFLLDKMRSLAIDSANLGINDDSMLQANQNELDELIDSISRIADYTQFGTLKLLDGTLGGDYKLTAAQTLNGGALAPGQPYPYNGGITSTSRTAVFQVGANENQTVRLSIPSTRSFDLVTLSVGQTSDGAPVLEYRGENGQLTSVTTLELQRGFNIVDGGGIFTSADPRLSRLSLFMLHSRSTAVSVDPFAAGVFRNTNTDTSTGTFNLSQGIGLTIKIVDEAIDEVSVIRGKIGALQADNLQVQLDSLLVAFENLQASESTIRDADMTREMAEFTKYQIMMQAGTAMLAQANQIPSTLLQLLQ